MRPRLLVAGGYAALDVVITADSRWNAPGGTAANVASNLAFLGWNTAVACSLGLDRAGLSVREQLRQRSVDVTHCELTKAVRTPIVRHIVASNGHRYRFGCNRCHRGSAIHRPLPVQRAERIAADWAADVFFFDRPSRVNRLLARLYRQRGGLVVYEPSTRATATAHCDAFALADVVKLSNDRLLKIGDRLPPRHRDCALIVTHGVAGCEYWIGSARERLPAPGADVTDSGGAGDWMTAALVHLLPPRLDQAGLRAALTSAQALAALSTSVPGATTLASSEQFFPAVTAIPGLTDLRLTAAPPPRSVDEDAGTCLGCGLPLDPTA